MPPRTTDEIATRRIHNLIGLFAVSVFFFVVAWLAGRGGDDAAAPVLLWLFGLMALASLGGWIALSAQRVSKIDKLMQ